MQEVTTDFKLIFNGFVLVMAFFWTFAYLNQIVFFVMSVYSKKTAEILPGNMIFASVFWTLYIMS